MNVFQCSNEFYPFQRRVSFSATVCLYARGQIRMCSWRGRRTGTDSSIREFSTRLLSRRCSTASLSSMRALPRDLFRFEKRSRFLRVLICVQWRESISPQIIQAFADPIRNRILASDCFLPDDAIRLHKLSEINPNVLTRDIIYKLAVSFL